jgi:Fe(3+) dicitrate transport protein
VIDVSARLKLLGPLSVYANVRNLLDDQNIVSHRPYGARPNAPRWIQAGAKVEF